MWKKSVWALGKLIENIKKIKNKISLHFSNFDQRSFPFSSGIHGGVLDHVELEFWKNPTPVRDKGIKRSKIQKVGRGVTFWGLETMVINIFSKLVFYMVQDAFRNAWWEWEGSLIKIGKMISNLLFDSKQKLTMHAHFTWAWFWENPNCEFSDGFRDLRPLGVL